MKKDQLEKLPKFTDIQSRVFQEKAGKIYVGGELVDEKIRSLLRDEAEYIERSRLWEIFNTSITNEAYVIALISSKNFTEVEDAKMLHHWAHFFRNVMHTLAKK